jgi:CubicO group peptidase (beta-lactamase class C family)
MVAMTGPNRLTVSMLLLLTTCRAAKTETPDFSGVAKELERAISEQAFPGCAVAVGTSEGLLWQHGFGRFVYDDEVARTTGLSGNPTPSEKTLYDLASLTKVIGTTSVVIALVRDGQLRLDDPVDKWLPGFSKAGATKEARQARTRITVEHLLVHASGLPAWKSFYREANSYDEILRAVASSPLESEPGTKYRYSDLGFMLLGDIASRAGAKPLADLERELIFAPLGMENTLRNPGKRRRAEIPPTELDPATKSYVHGVVHDENCRAAEGATGHAGLFSNARDLSIFAAELLRGLRGDSRVFPRELVSQFVRRREMIASSSRALGWDTPSGLSSGGKTISPDAFGHTGFTGTSIWIDSKRDVFFILLTNRVHPTRENRKISAARRAFANAVLEAVDGKRGRKDRKDDRE